MYSFGLAGGYINSVGGGMTNQWDFFFGGVFIGAVVMLIFVKCMVDINQRPIRKLITECEQSIPRDQQCELFAQPIEDTGR